MSNLELQIEETAVQLTQEDLDILSTYSWDMTGYTSRFGYFRFGLIYAARALSIILQYNFRSIVVRRIRDGNVIAIFCRRGIRRFFSLL